MDNHLKKQLAEIKARALRLRSRRESRAIVDDVVETGAVVRGSDFVPRPAPPEVSRRRSRRHAEDDVPPGEFLARFKTGDPVAIEDVAPGEVWRDGAHATYRIWSRGEAVDATASREAAAFARLAEWPADVSPRGAGAAAEAAGAFDPARVLFLDIETAGLSPNTYVFLCGLMTLADGGFAVEQVFARDYAEEVGLLARVREALAACDSVVTYNGARFDLPFLRTRMAVHRLPAVEPRASVDLLDATRAVFREVLPNRRLTTVERHLRRMERVEDIPGRYIPDAYHDFVRTGDARAMRSVLYHNRMDLFTMAIIVNRLAAKGTVAWDDAAWWSALSPDEPP